MDVPAVGTPSALMLYTQLSAELLVPGPWGIQE